MIQEFRRTGAMNHIQVTVGLAWYANLAVLTGLWFLMGPISASLGIGCLVSIWGLLKLYYWAWLTEPGSVEIDSGTVLVKSYNSRVLWRANRDACAFCPSRNSTDVGTLSTVSQGSHVGKKVVYLGSGFDNQAELSNLLRNLNNFRSKHFEAEPTEVRQPEKLPGSDV